MSELDELLPRRLDGLSDDLAGRRLRPADGIRRRAAQRSRRQAAVATLGTLVVAGVVGAAVLQTLPGGGNAQPPPPAGSTAPVVVSVTTPATSAPSPTSSAGPSATPDLSGPSAPLDPATALLPASAMPRTLPRIDTAWMRPQLSTDGSYWQQETSRLLVEGCWHRPVPAPRQEIVGTYGSDYMADAVEVVALAADTEAAEAAYGALREACRAEASPADATMAPAGGSIVRVTDLTDADEGFQVALDAEANGELAANVLTVLRQDDRIVMLLFRDVSKVSDLDVPALHQAALDALARVRP